MGFAHFIARRILSDRDRQDRLSRPIVLIAILGIVIGMAVMLLTVGISTGFQGEVRAKVTGAGAHIEILPLTQSDPKESSRVNIHQSFYPFLDNVPGIEHIQVFALKPGIVETDKEINLFPIFNFKEFQFIGFDLFVNLGGRFIILRQDGFEGCKRVLVIILSFSLLCVRCRYFFF